MTRWVTIAIVAGVLVLLHSFPARAQQPEPSEAEGERSPAPSKVEGEPEPAPSETEGEQPQPAPDSATSPSQGRDPDSQREQEPGSPTPSTPGAAAPVPQSGVTEAETVKPPPGPPPKIEPAAGPEGPVIELDDNQGAASEPEPGKAGAETAQPGGKTLVDRAASDKGPITLGGYGQHEFLVSKGEDPRFRNHRYVLFVYGQISQRISTATEIEFEFAGSPLKKDGIFGPGEVLLEFSVLDFEIAEWLVLRAGVILVPVSSFNINHDAPTRELVDRPIAYTTVVPTTWFESGAGVHGKIPLPGDQMLSYEGYVLNGLDARIMDGSGMRAARGSHFEDNNTDKAFAGRVAYHPTLNLELGLSGYTGEYDKRDNRVNMGNVDVLFRTGGLKLLGEAVYASIDPGFVEGFSEGSEANTRDPVPTKMWGYYVQGSYRFPVGPLLNLPGDLRDAAVTVAMRYEAKDTDAHRESSAGDARRMTLGVNFRPIQQLVVKSDFQWNSKGTDLERSAPDVWQSEFWDGRFGGFGFDGYAASVAYLF